jgi:hypothetical protein
VAPRLSASLLDREHQLPVGGHCWKTSRVLLPPELAQRAFRNEVTGAELRPVATESQAWLFAGQLFDTLPVAIIRAL